MLYTRSSRVKGLSANKTLSTGHDLADSDSAIVQLKDIVIN